MRGEIRRPHDAFKIATVYVTHDQSEAMVISDRIVVMNQGRIEQVDNPATMYRRPKTRFVAGFIGWTNLLDDERHGDRIVFPGFGVPVAGAPAADGPSASFSVRPQTIVLHNHTPADRGAAWWIEGRIEERASLGEYWEYIGRPAHAGTRLRVSTPPTDMHAVDQAVWMEIDPGCIAPIPPPCANGDLP